MKKIQFFILGLALASVQCSHKSLNSRLWKEFTSSTSVCVLGYGNGSVVTRFLSDSQILELKSLLNRADKEDPVKMIKKCRFDPEIGFVLSSDTKTDSVTIQFSQMCRMWKVLYRGETVYGNYDAVQESVDKFLEQFLARSPSQRKQTGISTEMNISERLQHKAFLMRMCKNGIVDGVFALPQPGQTLTPETIRDTLYPKAPIAPSNLKMLEQWMTNPDLYDHKKYRVMCDEPIAAIIQLRNGHNLVSTLYLFKHCGQLVFEDAEDRYTVSCPDLVQKIASIF